MAKYTRRVRKLKNSMRKKSKSLSMRLRKTKKRSIKGGGLFSKKKSTSTPSRETVMTPSKKKNLSSYEEESLELCSTHGINKEKGESDVQFIKRCVDINNSLGQWRRDQYETYGSDADQSEETFMKLIKRKKELLSRMIEEEKEYESMYGPGKSLYY
jgi:hypothetical protein